MVYRNLYRHITLLASLTMSSAVAGSSLDDTHYFRLGMFSQSSDIKAQVTVHPLPPVTLDFEDALGMDDRSNSIVFNYRWRFKEKWALSFVYHRLKLDGNREATRDFNWDGEEFKAGVAIDSEYTMDTWMMDVSYSFIKDQKKELGIGIGLHAFDIRTEIEAKVKLGDQVDEAESTQEDLLAPLPNLRLFGTYMLTPSWEINTSIGWLSANIDDYDGNYLYLDIGTEYRLTEHFAVGATYQLVNIDVEHETDKRDEKYDVDFSGPSLYFSYGF